MEFQPQLLKPTFFFCFTQPSMRNLTISYGWSKKGGGGTGTGRVRSVKSIISRARIFAFYCWLSTTGRLKHNNLPFSPSNYQVDCIKDFLPLHHFFPFLKIIWINTLILSWRLKKKGNPVFVWHIDNCMHQKKNIAPMKSFNRLPDLKFNSCCGVTPRIKHLLHSKSYLRDRSYHPFTSSLKVMTVVKIQAILNVYRSRNAFFQRKKKDNTH